MTLNQHNGQWGEQVSTELLISRECEKKVGRFVRMPNGEIDIVTMQEGTPLFFEVKTRTSNKMGLPEAAITARMREHMVASAEYFAAELDIDHWQIDVIPIEGKQEPNL